MERKAPSFSGIDPLGLARRMARCATEEAAARTRAARTRAARTRAARTRAARERALPYAELFFEELERSGAAFASSDAALQSSYYRALGLLSGCVLTSPLGTPMLIEGEDYRGCWLESTATIGAETLSRFCPSVARSTFELMARLRREDGLIPYKVLPSEPGGPSLGGPSSGGPSLGGPAFRQVQMVTPLARSVWNHAALNAEGKLFLSEMYEAMSANDDWLAAHRDTRGSGGVEAFCAFDTGHDLSPRFWGIPDTCYFGDPARYDPDSPLLPFIAPDMSANVYCQRLYLARIARALGRDPEAADWEAKAARSLDCVMAACRDPEDGFFYDLDRRGRFVRVQSDVLLRVLACEVGDDGLFAEALSRYLLNPRKFLSRFPPTSIAMDDPRFDPASGRNSWAGPTNVLSILRASAAFEPRGRHVELGLILRPALSAYARMERFCQCISPWSGEEGFGEGYSPALLGLLDAIERLVGILPRPDGELWFTALPLPPLEGGRAERESTAYSRIVEGSLFEFECGPEGAVARRDGERLFACPRGIRVVADRSGSPLALVGMAYRRVEGRFSCGGRELDFEVGGNEVLRLRGGRLESEGGPVPIPPSV